jgi:uncharacterized phage-associated protein
MHTGPQVANYFIGRGIQDRRPITLMQLMKLVFIAHGWSLAITETPLLSETFEAWKFGPVLRSLYAWARVFGSNPITGLIVGSRKSPSDHFHPSELGLMNAVWNSYGSWSAFELSEYTHREDSPWHKAWVGGGNERRHEPIDNGDIKEHYKRELGPATPAAAFQNE